VLQQQISHSQQTDKHTANPAFSVVGKNETRTNKTMWSSQIEFM